MEGNPQSPKIHELFDVEPEPGLSDLVSPSPDYGALIRATEFNGLMIMPGGSDARNKPDVFESEIFRSRLDALKQRFDYVIVDGHAVFGSSDPTHIAPIFDGIIFVVECEKTKWEVLQQAKERILNAGGKILGVILNKRKYYIPERLYGKT